MKSRLLPTVSAIALALAASSASADPTASPLPVPARGGQTFLGAVDPVGDVDSFAVFLAAGDVLTVTAKEAAPAFGLFCNLALADPSGNDAAPVVKGQDKQKASFTYAATTTGVFVLTITGDAGGFGGATGTYQLAVAVKRAKVPSAKFSTPGGGPISVLFNAPAGSSVTLSASTKKGGLDLTSLQRPDGTPEPGFSAALKLGKKRTSASASKFALTGGDGAYELRGNYDAGSNVTVKVSVATNEKKATRRLGDEPTFDVLLPPFPSVGIGGTIVNVAGSNFDDLPVVDSKGKIVSYLLPHFTVGGVDVPDAQVTHPNGSVYRFPVPGGLAPNASYAVTVVNADGQGAKLSDAFFIVPPPQITGISIDTAGPAGGRSVRLTGTDLRPNTTVVFDATFVQPTTTRPTYIDVVAPAHAPGPVTLSIRDEFGQTAAAPGQFTYLDVPSNRISTIFPTSFQGVGGETVTVRGADFGTNTVLTLDGVVQSPTLVSSSVMTFVPTNHAEATVKLRVTDQYQQTSAVDVRTKGFVDVTSTAIPAPVTTTNAVDGWRATRVLVGDVDGDGKPDLVLLRPERAFGGDVNRPRVRVLLGDGAGGFTDATSSKVPAVSGDEDWRAKDGVLADLFGTGRLDLAIVTDDPISSGARPGLRILRNTGNGVFSDATSTSVPAATSYGDNCQGVAIAAANLDSTSGTDLVVVHSEFFTDSSGPAYYAGTRVLLNNGAGVFSRNANALPSVSPSGATQYQGDAVAVGDVTGDGKPDIVITRLHPPVDPANSANYTLAASLLVNNGSAVFADVTSTKFPSANDPEYLQGTRLYLVDLDGDNDLDLVVASVTRVVSPVTSQLSPAPALRFFANDGTGAFSPMNATLPAADSLDQLQADGIAVGDVSGRGRPDLLLVSARPPNTGERGGRMVVNEGSTWAAGSKGLPDYLTGDDLRGSDAALVDADGDGAPDLVIVRDEADDTVRSTRVIRNTLKDFVNATTTAIPTPVATANAVDGWRAKRVLVGDVNNDGRPDAILLRPEKASGADANRPRTRVLLGGAGGVFTDATATSIPAVSGDEDWRAKGGALVDLDGDGDLDLVLVTDDLVSGGARSSLRVLLNNGQGVFTDATAAAIPAATSYGDHNQGIAVAPGIRTIVNGTTTTTFVDLVVLNTTYFTDASGPTYYPGTRVFVNNGSGVFSRKSGALPSVTPTSVTQYQGASLSVADANNDGEFDILVVRAQPPADPLSPGSYALAANLLVNNGSDVFTDVSATKLPARSEPEYLQADRAWLVDVTGDARPDIVLAASGRLTSPLTGLPVATSSLRVLANDGTGAFTATSTALPGADGLDYLQADGVAVADFTGDGRAELFLVSATAPNSGGRGGRILANIGGAWIAAPKMIPSPLPYTDDLRGLDAVPIDVDGDGDLDLLIVRDEPNDSVRNSIVLVNQRK